MGFLIQSTAGFGGQRVFNTIMRELAVAGDVDPLVITIDEQWSSSAADLGIGQISLRRRAGGPSALLLSAKRLSAVVRAHELTAVVSFMTYANLVNLLGVRLGNPDCRSVISEHTQTRSSIAGARFPLAMRTAVRVLYPSADAVLTVSEAVRTDLVDWLGLPPTVVQVVENPIDVEGVIRGAGRAPRPHRPPGEPGRNLISVGALNSAKGHRYAVEALATLPSDYRLDLVGDGPLRQELEDQAAALGVADRTRFHGFLANPYPLLAVADVLVHPSLREGFGLAVVEAGVLGVPVVAARVGGLPELVPDPVPGRLIRPADAGDLAAGIQDVLRSHSDPDVDRTRQRILERFSASVVSRRYREAATGSAHPRS